MFHEVSSLSASAIENSIYEVFKWPLKLIQSIGYLPLTEAELKGTIQQSKKFKLQKYFLNIYQSSIIIILACVLSYYWIYAVRYDPGDGVARPGTIDSVVMTSQSVVMSFWIYLLKFYGVIYKKKFQNFWKYTTFQVTQGIGSIVRHSQCNNSFKFLADLYESNKNWVKLYLIGLFVRICACLYDIISVKTVDLNFVWIWTNLLIPILWYLSSFGHIGLALWISAFLNLYTCCLQIINSVLDQLIYQNSASITDQSAKNTKNRVLPGHRNIQNNLRFKGHDRDEGIHGMDVQEFTAQEPARFISTTNCTCSIDTILLDCVRFYYKIEKCLVSFENTFSIILITDTIICIINLLIPSYYLYMLITRGFELGKCISTCMSLSWFIFALHCYTTAASKLSSESKTMLLKLQELSFEKIDPETRQIIQVLIIKISTCPPEPSPGMYFTLNRSLVPSVFSVLSTYLIVLIQSRGGGERASN